jgi:hypothetical protein
VRRRPQCITTPFTIFFLTMGTSELKEIIEISSEPLPLLDVVTNLVHDDGAGAISTFSGTTRDIFEGKLKRNINTISCFIY